MCAVESGQRRWPEWVERMAQPKIIYKMPSNEKPTRWQKPGPMSRDDWKNFYKWVSHQRPAPIGEKTTEKIKTKSTSKMDFSNRVMEPVPGVFIIQEQRLVTQQETQNAREELRKELSRPRYVRKKYVSPPKEVFTYCPCIRKGKPRRPERGRPKKPKVPCCFQNADIEWDFWSKIRFPVSRRAKRAKTTQRDIELSKPRCYPSKPIEKPPKRRKMSLSQWRRHQLRLLYLAMPNPRVIADLCSRSSRIQLCPDCKCPCCCYV